MVLFERMHTLAGFEHVLMGLLADRPNAEALADKILRRSCAWCATTSSASAAGSTPSA
jgi:hypothetical protein